MMTQDHEFMQLCLDLAGQAAAQGEVPVGAVIADPATGVIVAKAHNQPITLNDPTAHAEILAIREAGQVHDNYRLTGLDLFVSLEPCAMCTAAISFARLRRVVFAAADPKGGAVIHGPRFFDQPTCHWRPEVVHDTDAADVSAELLRSFFRERRGKRA